MLLVGYEENPTLDNSVIARLWGKLELFSTDFSLQAH
jgi:hypothetical protein